jgi:hypothetical protein
MKRDLGSSTELITLKPWCTGKQLPLGFSVFDQNRKGNYEMDNIKLQAAGRAKDAADGCQVLD